MAIDIDLEDPHSGYFLKPLFGDQSSFGPRDQESHFVVTQPQNEVKVKAKYGGYSAEAVVSPQVLAAAVGNHSTLLSNTIVDDLHISAHLVTRSLTQERPKLQVLFHSSHVGNTPRGKSYKSGDKNSKKLPEKGSGFDGQSHWCLQLHVEKGGQVLRSVCVLDRSGDRHGSTCVAELVLPQEWWDPMHTTSADVFYSVSQITGPLQCSSRDNNIRPMTPAPTGASHLSPIPHDDLYTDLHSDENIRSYIGAVTLTHGQMTYQEIQEDQHILVYVPQKSFYPGSKFKVPIKLQAESDLRVFVVR